MVNYSLLALLLLVQKRLLPRLLYNPVFPLTLWLIRECPNFLWIIVPKALKRRLCALNFRTNPVLKYTKCHISTDLLNFLKLCLLYCQKLFALAPTNRRFAEKNQLSGNTGTIYSFFQLRSVLLTWSNWLLHGETTQCSSLIVALL